MKRTNEKIERILTAIGEEFSVDPIELLSPKQGSKDVSTARQVAALMLRNTLNIADTGALLGRRNSAYAYGAISAITKRADRDYDFFMKVLSLCSRFSVRWKELVTE